MQHKWSWTHCIRQKLLEEFPLKRTAVSTFASLHMCFPVSQASASNLRVCNMFVLLLLSVFTSPVTLWRAEWQTHFVKECFINTFYLTWRETGAKKAPACNKQQTYQTPRWVWDWELSQNSGLRRPSKLQPDDWSSTNHRMRERRRDGEVYPLNH